MHFTHRFVQHRFRAFVALLALAATALALAACGGDDSGGGDGGGGSADAETLLRQTFTGTHDIRSGRVDVQLRGVAEGDPSLRGPIEFKVSGPFQSAGADELPEFDLALEVTAQGQTFEAGLTSTGGEAFVRFSGTAYEVPADLVDQLVDSWRRSQQAGSDQRMSLESLGIDPLSWLDDPTVEGTEEVGGTETDHITAGVNVSALLDDVDDLLRAANEQGLAGATGQNVPDSIPADARSQIEDAVKDATVGVWSGTEDHTLRRFTFDLTAEPSDSTADSIELSASVELTDLNEPQTIEAPATTRPLDELLGQFQGLLGGALGGAGGGAGGGASTEQLDEYTRCIEQAGSDVARAQECADLLTQ